MIHPPPFTYWTILFIALGAGLSYVNMGRRKVRPYVLPPVTNLIPNKTVRIAVEYVIFVVVGCVVGLFFVAPTNPYQAFTAGLG